MSYRIVEYLVRVDHVDGCDQNKGCGKECVRVHDGWTADYRLHLPNSERNERIRERIPDEWAGTKSRRDSWATQREVFFLQQYLDEGRRRSRMKVRDLAAKWLEQRKAEEYAGIDKDRQRIEDHILPVLGNIALMDVRPRHAAELVNKLKITPSNQGGNLAPRTVRAIFFTTKQLFEYAVLQELLIANPIRVGPRVLPAKADKHPGWRKSAVFTLDETEVLISDPRIPEYRRVAYAIAFLTSLRPGQVSALQWGDYEPTFEPLGRLSSSRSWNSVRKVIKATKTEVDHLVPVHPTLAKVLAGWRLQGWSQRHGRQPVPSDLLVPNINLEPRDTRKALEDFKEDLEKLDLRHRRVYDARRTFTSLALSAGAPKDIVRWITHPKPADVFDLYVTPSWESLCGAVRLIKVELRGGHGVVIPMPTGR